MSKPARGTASPAKGRAALRRKLATVLETVATEVPVATPISAPPAVESDSFFLKLEPSCTLRETADLQFSLVAATGDPLVIDGGGVERVDTAGLQLLVALARRQSAQGRQLQWKAVSAELMKCSQRLGLQQELQLPDLDGAPR